MQRVATYLQYMYDNNAADPAACIVLRTPNEDKIVQNMENLVEYLKQHRVIWYILVPYIDRSIDLARMYTYMLLFVRI